MKPSIIILLCFALMACNNSSKKDKALTNKDAICIDTILKTDGELGKVRNHACEQISLSKTIDNYTHSLQALDFEDCPKDFTLAFKAHINAWEDIKKVTDDYPELRGEMHDLFAEIENSKDSIEFKQLTKRIWDTWGDIETAAKQ